MGYIVRMPKLGMEMQEGVLLEWHAAEGEFVDEDDLLAEIESEKTVAEVTARESGVLHERLLEEGEAVEPGGAMGVLAAEDERVDDLLAEVGDETAEQRTDRSDSSPAETDASAGAERETANPARDGQAAAPRVRASPKARKLAADACVELGAIDGSGPGGAVVAADVESAAGESAGAPSGQGPGEAPGSVDRTVTERREFDGMRRTIADRLGESYRNAVHVTVDRDLDVEELLSATSVATEALDQDLSVTDVLLVCLSEALSAHPAFNATYEDGVHTLYEEQHVGIAVDVDYGLVTPVLRDLHDRSLAEIAAERDSLTNMALDGEYGHEDLAGGTFTVSNLGGLGVDSFTPVIDPPQVAILGINRIREVPRPSENCRGVTFRRGMTVSLSFDHRVVDGADAARFLDALADAVENPWPLLFDRT